MPCEEHVFEILTWQKPGVSIEVEHEPLCKNGGSHLAQFVHLPTRQHRVFFQAFSGRPGAEDQSYYKKTGIHVHGMKPLGWLKPRDGNNFPSSYTAVDTDCQIEAYEFKNCAKE